MTLVGVQFVLVFGLTKVVHLSLSFEVRKRPFKKDNLSLNLNQCHHPLIPQLNLVESKVQLDLSVP